MPTGLCMEQSSVLGWFITPYYWAKWVNLRYRNLLKSGRAVTIFSVATGGMHNNRRPLEGESLEEYEQRGYAQWHRVAVYQERMGQLAMRHIKQGTQVYLEGNIETRVYNEPVHGAVKRICEVAIRQNSQLLVMDQVSTS